MSRCTFGRFVAGFLAAALVLVAVFSGAYAASSQQALAPGDSLRVTCSTTLTTSRATDHADLSCAPSNSQASQAPVWQRPDMTQLGKSDGLTEVEGRFGSGTEPLIALQQCGYIAQGAYADDIWWTAHLPAPVTVFGIRFHTWQGTPDQEGIPMSEHFEFRDSDSTFVTTEDAHTPPGPAPFLVIDSPVPFIQDAILQGMLPSGVTITNLRIDAFSTQSWVTVGDLEILAAPATAGQSSCG
jgi:hypothetical protein